MIRPRGVVRMTRGRTRGGAGVWARRRLEARAPAAVIRLRLVKWPGIGGFLKA